MIQIQNYIDGALVPAVGGKILDNYEPATGAVYSTLPRSNADDVAVAVAAAKRAFPLWKALSPEERSKYLQKIADGIEARIEEFARAETVDNGKPLWLSRSVDIPRAVQNMSFFASAIRNFSSEAHPTTDNILNYTLRQPIGIVGCISPWNLPLYLFTWKIAPALASGNCVIAKPSELTPMTAFLFSQVCIEAGLPVGVLAIVHGLGAEIGSAIVDHSDISAISFTGGTATGATITRNAAPVFKKLSLELGGKNATIIFDDCDFDNALKTTVRSSFANQGEICLCGSRIYVQRGIYEKFKEAFVARVKELHPADPLVEGSKQGALVSKEHMEKVLSYIQLAKNEGGTILCGGNQVFPEGRCANGWFVQPTVIEGLPFDCRTNQEEIFGPVVTIQPFDTEDEVVEYANSTKYGLATSVWTSNLTTAHRVAANLHIGIVWINCWLVRDLRTPFGGVKHSGVGREGGFEALRFFTEPKNVCISLLPGGGH